MHLPLTIARRYLLAKQTRNVVNIITMISIVVMVVVAAAMVVVLSTLNGIGDLVDSIYSPFDQDITITPAKGKTFIKDSLDIGPLLQRPEVAQASWVIEENVLLRCGDQQLVATMKGVEAQYLDMSELPKHMFTGEPDLLREGEPMAILGLGLKIDLKAPLDDGVFRPLEIYAPVRGKKISKFREAAFESRMLAVSGAFSINIEFDREYLLVPIELASDLLEYQNDVNALEIKLLEGADGGAIAQQIGNQLGGAFTVKTRYQKNELMYRTNESEKWFTFLILLFIALIGGFNIIASLTMMMIEKKADMRTLVSMGATVGTVRRVFFYEGVLISVVGTLVGIVLGVGLCVLQQEFGFIELTGSIVETYPVKVLWSDLLLAFVSIVVIGLLASWVPLRILSRRYLQATVATA